MEFISQSHSSDWISFVLIAITFSYAIAHYFGYYSIKQSLASFLVKESSFQNEELPAIVKFVFSFNSLLVFGLFSQLFAQYLGMINTLDFIIFIRIIFGLMFLIGIQKLLLRIHSFFTEMIASFEAYLNVHANIIHFASLITLPLLWASVYFYELRSLLSLVGIGLFSGLYIFGILKTIVSSNKQKGSFKIHIILYLCGNEILPLLLLYKLLI